MVGGGGEEASGRNTRSQEVVCPSDVVDPVPHVSHTELPQPRAIVPAGFPKPTSTHHDDLYSIY
jgi:hypothetical protein